MWFKRIFTVISCFIAFHSNAQTVLVDEDFESGIGVFKNTGDPTWQVESALFKSGAQSLRNAYNTSVSSALELDTVLDLTAFSVALLNFWHIAKVEIGDTAVVQISTDSGNTWITLDTASYNGGGFLLFDERFFDNSYADWDFNINTTPDNGWWKQEAYNISAYTGPGNDKVKIRFRLGADNSLNWHGWTIDDVKITALVNGDIDLPIIQHAPIFATGSTQAVPIIAVITDASGIDSAQVSYRINAGAWIGPNDMTITGVDEYTYSIAAQIVGTTVDYYIRAIDSSLLKNVAFHPSNLPTNYHTYTVETAIFNYPYLENFETSSADDWTHTADLLVGNTGVSPVDDWRIGWPFKGSISSPYSGSDAYVTQLFSDYSANSRSSLITPLFDLIGLTNPSLAFYHRHFTQSTDGCRIDYTLDNSVTWKVLGTVNDINSNTWYNTIIIPSASDPIVKPGWIGSSDADWKFSAYNLKDVAATQKLIRFRFVFTSDDNFLFSRDEGWIIDDVSLKDFDYGFVPAGRGLIIDSFNIQVDTIQILKNTLEIKYTQYESGDIDIILYDINGKIVTGDFITNHPAGSYKVAFDVSNIGKGIYIAHVIWKGQTFYRTKLIKVN